jgi:hypothetical protein
VIAAALRPPVEGLAQTAILYGVALTLWTLVSAALAAPLRPVQQAAGGILGLAGAAVGIAYLIDLAGGHETDTPWVTVGYALAAILLLPASWPRGRTAEQPRLAAASACIGCLALTVVILRLRVVW